MKTLLVLFLFLPLLTFAKPPEYKMMLGNYQALYIVDLDGRLIGAGSGLAVSPTRVVTCFHLLKEGTAILNTDQLEAKVVAVEPAYDLALLEFAGARFVSQVRYAEGATVGEELYMIGNGLMISGLWQNYRVAKVAPWEVTIFPMPVPGDSGGAVYNAKGEVVGLIRAGKSAGWGSGVGYVTPHTFFRKLLR